MMQKIGMFENTWTTRPVLTSYHEYAKSSDGWAIAFGVITGLALVGVAVTVGYKIRHEVGERRRRRQVKAEKGFSFITKKIL